MDAKSKVIRLVSDRLSHHTGITQSIESTIIDLKSEITELEEAIQNNEDTKVEMELGDVIFNVLHLCSRLDLLPSSAVDKTIRKLNQRSQLLEMTNLTYSQVKEALNK